MAAQRASWPTTTLSWRATIPPASRRRICRYCTLSAKRSRLLAFSATLCYNRPGLNVQFAVCGGTPSVDSGAPPFFCVKERRAMSEQLLNELERRQFNQDIPEFRVGDTLRIGVRVVEGSRE